MSTKHPSKKFPCECGKGFETAKEFSDHVHDAHFGEAVYFAPTGTRTTRGPVQSEK